MPARRRGRGSAVAQSKILGRGGTQRVQRVPLGTQTDLVKSKPIQQRKYRNQPTEVDGQRFASKREAGRYVNLSLAQRAGEIADLETQVSYRLEVNGVKIGFYIADFRYRDLETGEVVVEDAKGVRTPVYRLKAKLMRACHGITVREV